MSQSPEYKALMARLRREEEARNYERMLNPPPQPETFDQRFPNSPKLSSYATSQSMIARQNVEIAVKEEDEVTYAEINRQLALIANVLISIVACSFAIWMAARHWNTPARLALAMSGSIIVAVAEVAIYAGYIRRVGEAKQEERKRLETKEVMDTWVIDAQKGKEKAVRLMSDVLGADPKDGVRQRKGK